MVTVGRASAGKYSEPPWRDRNLMAGCFVERLELNGAADPLVGEGERGRHEQEVEEEHGDPHHW